MKVYAPGKLILSGEHAVVYGMPALAMAVNRYVCATASSQLLPLVSFDLSDFAYESGLTFTALNRLKNRIKQKYKKFISGDFKIRDVLQKPAELAQFAITLFLENFNLKLINGVKIKVHSDIPIGCGMGSSAATILSIVHAIAKHLEIELTPEIFYRLGIQAENMQHGHSSGLDLRVSMHGGCHLLKDGQLHARAIPSFPLYLVNTGTPLSSTGECVEKVASLFKHSNIWQEFGDITQQMDRALEQNNLSEMIASIRANQRLLNSIGIVPEKVGRFVNEVEQLDGGAKICGAGTVAGDKAGVMLVMLEDANLLTLLCDRFQYAILPIEGVARGVHAV